MSLAPDIWAFLRKLHLYALLIINKGLIINLMIISLIRFLKYTFVLICSRAVESLAETLMVAI